MSHSPFSTVRYVGKSKYVWDLYLDDWVEIPLTIEEKTEQARCSFRQAQASRTRWLVLLAFLFLFSMACGALWASWWALRAHGPASAPNEPVGGKESQHEPSLQPGQTRIEADGGLSFGW